MSAKKKGERAIEAARILRAALEAMYANGHPTTVTRQRAAALAATDWLDDEGSV